MAKTGKAFRRRTWMSLAVFALLAGCSQVRRQDAAEREFNAWANQVDQASANGQMEAPADLEEPTNVLARVVPANAQ